LRWGRFGGFRRPEGMTWPLGDGLAEDSGLGSGWGGVCGLAGSQGWGGKVRSWFGLWEVCGCWA